MTSQTLLTIPKGIIYLLILTLSSCGSRGSRSPVTSSQDGGQSSICVQTFNAYGPAYSTNISGRTKTWGQELANSPCAIIQSQEVWSGSHYDLALKAMTKSLPLISAVRFDSTQHPYKGKSGLALFTNHHLSETSFEAFTVNRDGVLDDIRSGFGVIKGMGSSHLTLREENHELTLIDLHTHPSSTAVRVAQMAQLLGKFDQLLPLEHPLIISGDFNFEPDSVEYRMLHDVMLMRDAYVDANGQYTGTECTYCAANPHHWGGGDRVIDYIWTRNSKSLALAATKTLINLRGLNGIVPSDHYGLRSLLEIRASESDTVDEATFEQRRHLAILATDAGIQTLKNQRDTSSAMNAAYLELLDMKARLTAGDPTDRFLAQLAIP